jgi:hypothetical protein
MPLPRILNSSFRDYAASGAVSPSKTRAPVVWRRDSEQEVTKVRGNDSRWYTVQRPALRGHTRCRLHGALSPGAPRGHKNGNFRNGICDLPGSRRGVGWN